MTTTILAAVQMTPQGPVEVREGTLGEPTAGTVLVRLISSGVCHSQLIHLDHDRPAHPMLLGHEGFGEVIAIGEPVRNTSLTVGSKVLVSWLRDPSVAGAPEPASASIDGVLAQSPNVFTWATHTLVSERHVIVLPPDKDHADSSAVAACAIATGYGAAQTYFDEARPSAAVIGLGGVGLSAIAGLRDLGANPILALDLSPDKLALAQQLGATHAINATVHNVHEVVRELTPSQGWVCCTDR